MEHFFKILTNCAINERENVLKKIFDSEEFLTAKIEHAYLLDDLMKVNERVKYRMFLSRNRSYFEKIKSRIIKNEISSHLSSHFITKENVDELLISINVIANHSPDGADVSGRICLLESIMLSNDIDFYFLNENWGYIYNHFIEINSKFDRYKFSKFSRNILTLIWDKYKADKVKKDWGVDIFIWFFNELVICCENNNQHLGFISNPMFTRLIKKNCKKFSIDCTKLTKLTGLIS